MTQCLHYLPSKSPPGLRRRCRRRRRRRRTVHAGAVDLGLPIYPATHSITGSVIDKDIEVLFVSFSLDNRQKMNQMKPPSVKYLENPYI